MQKFSDAPITTHEGCGGKVERLLSAPALQFKGTGWYVTDYARKNGSGANGSTDAKSGSSKESGSSAPAKGEAPSAKPETSSKTESKPSK
jgi:predicted nucleic acid-binding Zn ribbon protein